MAKKQPAESVPDRYKNTQYLELLKKRHEERILREKQKEEEIEQKKQDAREFSMYPCYACNRVFGKDTNVRPIAKDLYICHKCDVPKEESCRKK